VAGVTSAGLFGITALKLIPALAALLLAAAPCFAQSAPERDPNGTGGVPTPPLNQVTADNQQAGAPLFTLPRNTCPGGIEQALRHQIETMVAGPPDYGAMTPSVANQWRTEIDRSAPATRQWGALVSLKPYSRAWRSAYEAQFEHARVQWKIACKSSHGKITGISFKTLS